MTERKSTALNAIYHTHFNFAKREETKKNSRITSLSLPRARALLATIGDDWRQTTIFCYQCVIILFIRKFAVAFFCFLLPEFAIAMRNKRSACIIIIYMHFAYLFIYMYAISQCMPLLELLLFLLITRCLSLACMCVSVCVRNKDIKKLWW